MNTKILIIRLLLCSLVFNQINADCNAADAVKQLPNLTNSSFCSYAGFAPLDIKNESALFYWYVPNQLNLPNQPIIVWLQGELGLSSTWGLLTEGIGPIKVTPNPAGGYYVNYTDDGYDKSWSYNYNILFIDNPVGVGFSYFTPNKTNATQSVEEVRNVAI